MKINLEVENKEVVFPEFDLYFVNKNKSNILIVIKNFDSLLEKYIINSIKNNDFVCGKDNYYFILETKSKKFYFNIYEILKYDIKEINIDFYDESNIIKNIIDKTINIQ